MERSANNKNSRLVCKFATDRASFMQDQALCLLNFHVNNCRVLGMESLRMGSSLPNGNRATSYSL